MLGLGFRVWGLGFRVWDLGIIGFRFEVLGLGFRVQGVFWDVSLLKGFSGGLYRFLFSALRSCTEFNALNPNP